MIDIRREKMFPDDVFVMDHLVPNINYKHDTKKIKKVYEKKLKRARKSGLYKNYVFYSATDGWHDIFDSFLNSNDIIAITGNYKHSTKWHWFPHWQVVVDATDPLPTTKEIPDFRWQYWVRRPRPHRIELLQQIAKLNISGGDIIFPTHLVEPSGLTFPPTQELFSDKKLYKKISKQFNPPIDIAPGTNGAYVASYQTRQNRAIDVVTETMCNSNGGIFLSEKTFKALRAGQLFFILGQKGSIKELQDYGYKVFDKWLDHSYDCEDDTGKRAEMIASELKRISQLNNNEFNRMWHDTYEDRLHNQLYKNYKLDYWKKYLKSFF